MEAKMTKPALGIQDAALATMLFQELVSESSTRNPPPVDSIIPPSAFLSFEKAVLREHNTNETNETSEMNEQ